MLRYDKLLLVRTLERKFGFYKSITNKKLKILWSMLLLPAAFKEFLESGKKIVLPYMEIAVTEACNLNCISCANLMPCYRGKNPQHYSYRQIKGDIDALKKKIRRVYVCQVLGGEPFLNPELHKILNYLTEMSFIEHIQVVTNGTMLPRELALNSLKNRKITVLISDYGQQSIRLGELQKLFKDRGIGFLCQEYENWLDYGNTSDKKLTEEELRRSYRDCAAAECKTLLKGRLFTCPRSAHMCNLGLLDADTEGISIVGKAIGVSELKGFYNRDWAQACRYCNPADRRRRIPAGEQIPVRKPVSMEEPLS